MNNSYLFRIVCCLALCLGSAWVNSEPRLNGIAAHTELNKERFIAVLYSEQVSDDANTLLNSQVAKRMEFKVTDRRLSARSVNSMWIEGMAINNSSQELEAHAEDLAKLTNMVRKSLVEGDILQIDFVPGNGSKVTVNGVNLGTINSDEFFPLLLRTWIGRVPLSSDFKTGLLGNGKANKDLLARYEGIEADPSRAELIASWAAPIAPVAANEENDSSLAMAPPPPKLVIPAPAPTPAPKPSTAKASELAEPTVKALREKNTQEIAAAGEKSVTLDPTPVVSEATTPPKTEPAKPKPATETPAQVAKVAPPAVIAEEEDDEEIEVFSASSLLQRQYFISSSLSAIQKHVSYPRRAMERDQQGTVRLAVTINRQGEIQNVQTVEESKHVVLTKAALKAVEDSAPFQALPKALTGETFTFTVPITFALKS